jgi:transcriptional regulator with XRE-family HTH domain
MPAQSPALRKFRENIRSTREARELSQEKLAGLAELDRTYSSGVERGVRKLSIPSSVLIAKGGELSATDLVEKPRRQITFSLIGNFLLKMETEAFEDPVSDGWVFKNGGSVFQCTAGARCVADHFGGHLVGFFSAENPKAIIARGMEGHDFAIISGRFLVDYWGARVARIIPQAIFDLQDADNHASVVHLYGAQNLWHHVHAATRC